jgi:hypothetical protein
MRTPEYVWKIKNEVLTIRRLNHRHIVQVVPTHRLATYLAITVLHVAEKNFADLLDEIDQMKEGVEKSKFRADAEVTRLSHPSY